MKVMITGEKGFIAKNLIAEIETQGHEFISFSDAPMIMHRPGEPCVHQNSVDAWAYFLKILCVDVVIHNAAIVGTDVVALNPTQSTLTNVMGTYNIVRACEKANCKISFMGTSVIYNASAFQKRIIREGAEEAPHTYYGQLKLAGEHIVRKAQIPWQIIRPLFAYGGEGDMNSLIIKGFYAAVCRTNAVKMFLNPEKSKDYLHVTDYAKAVVLACNGDYRFWRSEFNISAENPYTISQIIEMMDSTFTKICGMNGRKPSDYIRWYPEADYLGNHQLSSQTFRQLTDWKPQIKFQDGLQLSLESLLSQTRSLEFNPLAYLDEADKRGIDLKDFY